MKAAVAVLIVVAVTCGIASSQQVDEKLSVVHPYASLTPGALSSEPERAQALLKSVETVNEALHAGFDVGTLPMRELYPWSKRWMEIELNLAKTKAEARAALAAHLDRMAAVFKKVEALHRAGAKGGEIENYEAAKFAKIEAEILLLRAGGELPEEHAR